MNAFTPRTPRLSGRDYKRPGSNEKLVAANGDLNGYDKRDLSKNIGDLILAASRGEINLDPNYKTPEQEVVLTDKQQREMLKAAYDDYASGNTAAWADIGNKIAADVVLQNSRAGFMRNLLMRNEPQGRVAQIRTRINNVTAVYMATSSHIAPQYITNTWFTVPEFDITAFVMISGREIMYEGEAILQEQYDYALEAFLAAEDRRWKALADSIVGTAIPLQVFTGDFTPDDLTTMMTLMSTNGVTPNTILMYVTYWTQMLNNSSFANWFDPATRYEMIHSGNVGSILGINFMTDARREANLKVLQPGEIYLVGVPEQHGGYTDRGPINAVPTDGYNQGQNSRGWFMQETLAMSIVNPCSVVKGRASP